MKGIRKLADHLGISIGTVSRALNNRPDVSRETRERVLQAAAQLGYEPDQAGRSLRQGTTSAVGFVVESSRDASESVDNFFLGVFDGVQQVFARHHLDLIVLPCSADEDPLDFIKRTVARRMVDALIISGTRRRDDRIAYLVQSKVPFIALGRSETPGPHPWIDLDFESVANTAVDRLVAAGHRRIAVALPDNDINLGFIYLESYKAALSRHNIPFDPELVMRTMSSEQGGYQVGHQILSMRDRPTGVIACYELMTIGLYRRLHEAGLTPGKDLAVISFRETPLSRFLSPTLTCFRLSLRDLGVALGVSLLASMPQFEESYPQGVTHRIWPLELIPGESDDPSHAKS